MAREELVVDKKWKDFEAHFRNDQGEVTIDEILARFENDKALIEEKQWAINVPLPVVNDIKIKPRKIYETIVSYAESFKDIGNAIANCDPTKHAVLAWNVLQYLVSVCAHTIPFLSE